MPELCTKVCVVSYADVLTPHRSVDALAFELFLWNAAIHAINNPFYPTATQSRLSCWSESPSSFLGNSPIHAIRNPFYPTATQSRLSSWSPSSFLGNSPSVLPEIPAPPRALVRTTPTSDIFLHSVNSADLLKHPTHASLYRPRRLTRVQCERKTKTENSRCARVARENASVRKVKYLCIALRYAERLALREKDDASYLHQFIIPKPELTSDVPNAVVGDGDDAPATVSRRLRTMPALQLITMIIYFGTVAGGTTSCGARGSGAAGGQGIARANFTVDGSGGNVSGVDNATAGGTSIETAMLNQCRYIYNTDTENNCSPFVSPFDALPNSKRMQIIRSYLFTCEANKNMRDCSDPIVSDNSGDESDVRNGVYLEGGGKANASKPVQRADGWTFRGESSPKTDHKGDVSRDVMFDRDVSTPGGSVTKELYVASRKRTPENEDAQGKRKRVNADRSRINRVLMLPTKRAKTLKAGRERNATPDALAAAAKRNATPDALAAAAERNATPDALAAAAKRNATPAARSASAKRNATPAGRSAAAKRNGTPEALFLVSQRKAKPGALLMDRERKARGSKIHNSAKAAAKVTEKNARKEFWKSRVGSLIRKTAEERNRDFLNKHGTRDMKHKSDRQIDAHKRASSVPHDGRPPAACWPPPAPSTISGTSNLDRVSTYFNILSSLATNLHTCPNCRQSAHDHGTDVTGRNCWFCVNKPRLLHWSNGLDLDLRPDDDPMYPTSAISNEARSKLQDLILLHGELSPVEEALIARVRCCTTCLKLPSEGQLGFRGNVINFLSDTAIVNKQLPCSPAECGVLRYRIERENTKHKLESVRKAAVMAWLNFLIQYHPLYVHGVRDTACPPGTSDKDDAYWIVPPFDSTKDFNNDVIKALPDDGVPPGLPEFFVAEADCAFEIDPTLVQTNSDSEDSNDDEPFDADSQNHQMKLKRRMKITSGLLSKWLRTGDGVIVCDFRARISNVLPTFDLSDDSSIDDALAYIFDHSYTTPRVNHIELGKLARVVYEKLGKRKNVCDIDHWCCILHTELLALVRAMPLQFDESGDPNSNNDPNHFPCEKALDAIAIELDEKLAGADGTIKSPFPFPTTGKIPLSEFKTKGLATLAFPTLFPFGLGHFDEIRDYTISWDQWSQHLGRYYDGRFANHPRFMYFVLNQHERAIAIKQADIFYDTESVMPGENKPSVGDLNALSAKSKQDIFGKLSKYAGKLRNSPAFFGDHR